MLGRQPMEWWHWSTENDFRLYILACCIFCSMIHFGRGWSASGLRKRLDTPWRTGTGLLTPSRKILLCLTFVVWLTIGMYTWLFWASRKVGSIPKIMERLPRIRRWHFRYRILIRLINDFLFWIRILFGLASVVGVGAG